MNYKLNILVEAELDLENIYYYIAYILLLKNLLLRSKIFSYVQRNT